jgi:Tfp pilus assembly protein PilV
MRRNVVIRALIAFIALTAGISGLITQSAHAQATNATAAQGIQISPALAQLNADPGKSYTVKVTVTNVTSSNLVYTTTIDDFKAKDETGTPEILANDTLPPTASVRTWIQAVPQFNIGSQQQQIINAVINVPANAEPGGHYGVIQFTGSAPDLQSTGVGLSVSAGLLVLIRVSGDINESANLASFSTTTPKENQTFFFETGPINFVTRVRNTGNVYIAPQGTIELTNMFGKVISTMKVNSDGSNVLSDSIRRFENTYDKTWMFGRYTADLTLGYGTKGEAITGETSFWVIPYRLILVSLLIVVTVVFVLTRVIRMYNNYIIQAAKKQNEKKPNEKKPKSKTTTKKK